MNIRDLHDRDIVEVIALWHRCGLIAPGNDPHKDIARARAAPNATLMVGTRGIRVIATVMTGFDGHRGWAYYLAVDPTRQSSGHGRSIMSAA